MTTKSKSLVCGYIRDNYHLFVPDVIAKRCLLYFDPETIVKFKGKCFQKFLEQPNGNVCKTKIKFNQDISFVFGIYPNGFLPKHEGFVGLWLYGNPAENIDYYAINFEISCVETQTLVPIFYKMSQSHEKTQKGNGRTLLLSECKQQKELTFKFVIHSLELKYKNERKKVDRLFYPSLISRSLQKETFLNWNIDGERVRNCAKRQTFHSKVVNNWKFECCPNGINDKYPDQCGLWISLMSWPLKVSKIELMITVKADGAGFAESSERQVTVNMDDYNKRKLVVMFKMYDGIEWESIEKISFHATIIIQRLYDMNDDEIAIVNWKDHNVDESSIKT